MTPDIKFTIGTAVLKLTRQVYLWWRKNAENAVQAELDKLLAELQQSKRLDRQIGEELSRSLQSLHLSDNTVAALRHLDSDQIFHEEMASLLHQGGITPEKLLELIQTRCLSHDPMIHELKSVVSIWLDAIYLTVANRPTLSNALQLRSQAKIENLVDARANGIKEIIAQNNELAASQSTVLSNNQENLALSRDTKNLLSTLITDIELDNTAKTLLERQFETKFKENITQLKSGSIISAEKGFTALISDLINAGKLGSQDLLFRSYLNQSSCLVMQDRIPEAIIALDLAKNIYCNDIRLQNHKATILSYQGRNSEALEVVRSLRCFEPNEVKHITSEIAILVDLEKTDELAALLASVDFCECDFQTHKAHALLLLGRIPEALAAAQRAVELSPDSEGPWIALDYVTGFPVVTKDSRSRKTSLLPQGEEMQKMELAINALRKADAILVKRDRPLIRAEVQSNLLAFLAFTMRDDESLEIATQIEITPNLWDATLENLYCLFIRNNLPEKSLEVANAIVSKHPNVESQFKLVAAMILLGQFKDASRDLAVLADADDQIVTNEKWITLSAQMLQGLHQIDKALDLLTDALIHNPNSAELHLEKAAILIKLGRRSLAEEHFVQAENIAGDDLQVALDYGLFLYAEGKWKEAKLRFEQTGAALPIHPYFPQFMVCLFNTGEFYRSLELAYEWKKDARKSGGTVLSIAARSAFLTNDLTSAKRFLEQLILLGGQREAEHRKMLGQIYLRLNDLPEAYSLLSQFTAEHRYDAGAFSLLGRICSAYDKHCEALECHQKAIELDASNVELRSAFFGSMLATPDDFIPTEEQLRLHHENISILASHPSKILRPIYIPVKEDQFDFSVIQKELNQRGKAVKRVLRFADRNPLPVSLLSKRLGASLFDTLIAFSQDRNRGVRMCSGSAEDLVAQIDAVKIGNSVSPDLVALITLQRLGILDLLPHMFSSIFVHISILDEVVSDLRACRDFPNSGQVTSVNGKMIYLEPNSVKTTAKISALAEICDFLKRPTTVILGLRADVHESTSVKASQNVHNHFDGLMAPALLAAEKSCALLSDDLVVRVLSEPLKIPTFSTQALLRIALQEKFIQEYEFHDSLLRLHELNYHFVSHNYQTLVRLFERTNEKPTELAKRLVSLSGRNGIISPSAISVLADFLIHLWCNVPFENQQRLAWIEIIWSALFNSPSNSNVICVFMEFFAEGLLASPAIFRTAIEFAYNNTPVKKGAQKRAMRMAITAALDIERRFPQLPRRLRHEWKVHANALEIRILME